MRTYDQKNILTAGITCLFQVAPIPTALPVTRNSNCLAIFISLIGQKFGKVWSDQGKDIGAQLKKGTASYENQEDMLHSPEYISFDIV